MTDNSKNSTQATKYAVTAIRFVLCGENASDEERDKVAEELVYSVKPGTRVQLIHEPGNPYDHDAVAVYMKWKGERRHVGYINSDDCSEVRNRLHQRKIGEGEVTGVASHVAFRIELVNAPEVEEDKNVEKQKLPESPLVESIQLRATANELGLQLVMDDINSQGKPTRDNVGKIISLLEEFVDLARKSLCHEDGVWLRNMQRLSEKLLKERESLRLTEQEYDEVGQLERRMEEIISDSTCNKDEKFLVEVMEKELDEYRKMSRAKGGFFEKYYNYYLRDSLENGDKDVVKRELERLKHWMKDPKCAELHNYKEKKEFAKNLKYARLSRCELRKIYAVILLIERLEARAAICATDVNVASHDKPKEAEGDPLPVFDYEIERRRLLEKMRTEPLKSGGNISVYGNIYINGPTENKFDVHGNEHVDINPNLRTMTHNHGER